MHYEGTVIRPPSEAGSIILQVTVGCSHNRCTFCGAYRDVQFRLKEEALVDLDISFAAKHFRNQNRVFLADGDALIISQKKLEVLFKKIKRHLPQVNRISLYANAHSIRQKNTTEFSRLRQLGLDRVYMGIESGDTDVLKSIKKNETAESLETAGKTIVDNGFFLSTSIILGLTETKDSHRHAVLTAELLNKVQPTQIAALSFIPLSNTELGQLVLKKKFKLLTSIEILKELKILISHLSINKTQFMANHASNYLALAGRLQKDKIKLISRIDEAIAGVLPIKDEQSRAL